MLGTLHLQNTILYSQSELLANCTKLWKTSNQRITAQFTNITPTAVHKTNILVSVHLQNNNLIGVNIRLSFGPETKIPMKSYWHEDHWKVTVSYSQWVLQSVYWVFQLVFHVVESLSWSVPDVRYSPAGTWLPAHQAALYVSQPTVDNTTPTKLATVQLKHIAVFTEQTLWNCNIGYSNSAAK